MARNNAIEFVRFYKDWLITYTLYTEPTPEKFQLSVAVIKDSGQPIIAHKFICFKISFKFKFFFFFKKVLFSLK